MKSAHIQRKGDGKTKSEVGHLQTNQKGLKKTQTYRHFDLGLPATITVRK
jgi:hypothetical protein